MPKEIKASQKLRPVRSDALLDAIPDFAGLASHILNEQAELSPEERKELETSANEIHEAFFKLANGKHNGAVVIAGMFVIYKIVEGYKKDLGAYRGGSTLVQ